MVITDTITRWNSSYLSISRALKLRDRIDALQVKFANELDEDALSDDDWTTLERIIEILTPFASVTKRLEGRAALGSHGSVWEALPALESLIKHLDTMKLKYTQAAYPELAISINLAWSKLDDYYKKLDESPAYAAALVLHPRYRLEYITEKWTGPLRKYIAPAKKAIRELYMKEYKHLSKPIPQPGIEVETSAGLDFFDSYMESVLPTAIEDEYIEYSSCPRLKQAPDSLYQWWAAQSYIPSVQQMAFDLLSIPAMSAETERVFSDTSIYLSSRRARMGSELLEALECENKWMKAGI